MQALVPILRDPMVRTILAIVAICITLILFLLGRRRKGLSYMLSEIRVLGLHEAVSSSRVEILFDGSPVTDVRLVTITVNNSGNEAIRVDDFDRALRFSWSEPTRILSAEVAEANPESLHPTIKVGTNEILLDPLLLNRGDWLRVKALINEPTKLLADARIVGVKRINKTLDHGKQPSGKKLRLVALVGFFATALLLFGRGFGLWAVNGRAELEITRISLIIILLIMMDQLRDLVLDLRNYYIEKRSGSK